MVLTDCAGDIAATSPKSPRTVFDSMRPYCTYHGLVEAVLLAHVPLDGRRQRLFAGVEVARGQADEAPGERHHDEHHRHDDEQPADDEARHLSSRRPTSTGRARCRRTSTACMVTGFAYMPFTYGFFSQLVGGVVERQRSAARRAAMLRLRPAGVAFVADLVSRLACVQQLRRTSGRTSRCRCRRLRRRAGLRKVNGSM